MNGQATQNSFAWSLQTSSVILILILAACLCMFLPPLIVAVPLAAAVVLWSLCRHPIAILGALLAFMPIDYLAIELGKFFGLPHMSLVSACTKEIPLLLVAFILWRRNEFKPLAPDWFVAVFCAIATIYTVVDGSWAALAIDLSFVVPYFVGRMTVLNEGQERKWAVRAVWIIALLAGLGMIEIFILGEGPRTLLYASTGAMTENGALTASFRAMGYEGMREAAGMVGPNGFGALCMIGLVIWWVYCRNPLPAGMIAAGLVCSMTRSAWAGVAVAIPILAFVTDQRKRFFVYAAVSFALFAVSIPILGLSDFLFLNKTGQDLSAEGHRSEIVAGLTYVAEHPLGSGNRNIGPAALSEDANATVFETTYPSLAAKYGVLAALCFVSFLGSTLNLAWRQKSLTGNAAVGIIVGMAAVMAVTLPLDDRRLACWALFPVGLAVRSSIGEAKGTT